METPVYKTTEPGAAETAARVLAEGGLAVIPTETVYGLAVNPENAQAMEKLYALKGRDRDKPLTRFIGQLEELSTGKPVLPRQVQKAAKAFWPGPLTLVVEYQDGESIGLRMPDDKTALAVARALPFQPAVTSVNASGEPPLTTIKDIMELLDGKVDCILDSGSISGTPSTVAAFGRKGINLLREGATPFDELRDKATFTIMFVCSGNICRSAAAEYYLRDILRRRLQTDNLARFGFRIISSGTFLLDGKGCPHEIREIMAAADIDIAPHRSQSLTRELMETADLVLAMDEGHMEDIRNHHPKSAHKASLLHQHGLEIYDPFQQGMTIYTESLNIIKQSVMEVAKTL